jgi:hypothetical protein
MACLVQTDICRKRGDTYPERVSIKDSAGVAVPITGGSFTLSVTSIQDPPDATTLLFAITGAITDGPGGIVQFTPSVGLAGLTPNTYYYDVQWTDTGGLIRTILQGAWVLGQDNTK